MGGKEQDATRTEVEETTYAQGTSHQILLNLSSDRQRELRRPLLAALCISELYRGEGEAQERVQDERHRSLRPSHRPCWHSTLHSSPEDVQRSCESPQRLVLQQSLQCFPLISQTHSNSPIPPLDRVRTLRREKRVVDPDGRGRAEASNRGIQDGQWGPGRRGLGGREETRASQALDNGRFVDHA